MEFLGIGPAELILILLVIILVIGPKDIGKTARSVGRFLNRLYKSEEWRTVVQASKTIRTLPNRLAREAELESLQEVKSTLEETKKELEDAKKGLDTDVKKIEEIQKDLIKETKAIDTEMKAIAKPVEKEAETIETITNPESEKEIKQDHPSEVELQDN